jgi:hypothetical protein
MGGRELGRREEGGRGVSWKAGRRKLLGHMIYRTPQVFPSRTSQLTQVFVISFTIF